MNCELQERTLDNMYDQFHQEHMRLSQLIKSGNSPEQNKNNQKEITILNSLLRDILKLKTLKQKQKDS
jgi:hypothetical protein